MKHQIYGFVAAAVGCISIPASAMEVQLIGTVVNSCVLTLDTPGLLGSAASGTELSSELGSGVSSVVAVAALGTGPTLSFSSPVADEPAGQSGSTANIKYRSLSGANQGWTDQPTTTSSLLVDLFTIDGKITNEDGFVSGPYSVTTEVTCSQ